MLSKRENFSLRKDRMGKNVKLAFAGTQVNGRCSLLNYDCAEIRNTQITRTSAGKYTINFLTSCNIDETKKTYPIINVTCQSSSGTATVVNVLNPTATYQSQNTESYLYLISFQIETQNVLLALPLVGILLGCPLVTFVDRPIVTVDCEMSSLD